MLSDKRFLGLKLLSLVTAVVTLLLLIGATPQRASAGEVESATVANQETVEQAGGEIAISNTTFIVIKIAVFLVGFFGTAILLLAPMFFPSFRSVGSPDEIIEEIGLGEENRAGKKILIAYDTRHGTTAITAQKMGQRFADKGYQVDVRCLRKLADDEVSGYDAYVVGSWIYYMGISNDTVEFLRKHRKLLADKPLLYFVVCGKLLTGSTDEVGNVVRSYIKRAETEIPELKPLDLGMFPGGVILSKLSFWERVQIVIKMHKLRAPRMKEGIFVDDRLIEQWTTNVARILS